jgi:porin
LLVILLAAAPVSWAAPTVEAVYTGDYLRNMDGGIREDDAYMQRADLMFEADIQAVLGEGAATIFANVLYTDKTTFSDRIVGDAQVVSNIENSDTLRLFELWYEQRFGNLSAKFGLYAVDSEFDVTEAAQLFLNSSHGTGADLAQSGLNGPSIFPVTSLGLRLDWPVSATAGLRYAILDGVPGDINDPDSAVDVDLGDGDGVLHLIEFNKRWADRWRVGLGYWRYSADFDYIDRVDGQGNPLRGDGNDGWYLLTEGPLWGNAETTRVNGFLRYGQADDAFNDFGSYLGAGFVVESPFGRPDDQLGFAIASAEAGDALRRANPGTESRETILEFTYSLPVTDWLRLQPDLQYVLNPGVDPGLGDAWVIGVRIEMGNSWELGR